jgi:hypothetical protein
VDRSRVYFLLCIRPSYIARPRHNLDRSYTDITVKKPLDVSTRHGERDTKGSAQMMSERLIGPMSAVCRKETWETSMRSPNSPSGGRSDWLCRQIMSLTTRCLAKRAREFIMMRGGMPS